MSTPQVNTKFFAEGTSKQYVFNSGQTSLLYQANRIHKDIFLLKGSKNNTLTSDENYLCLFTGSRLSQGDGFDLITYLFTIGNTVHILDVRNSVILSHSPVIEITQNTDEMISLSINAGNEVFFNFVIKPLFDINRLFISTNVTGALPIVTESDSESQLTANFLQPGSRACPMIFIEGITDWFYGENLAQVLFRVFEEHSSDQSDCNKRIFGCKIDGNKLLLRRKDCHFSGGNLVMEEFLNYPDLTVVVRGKACTLVEKAREFSTTQTLPEIFGGIILYGMLRYFLWKLMKGLWDIDILLQRNTKKFFSALDKSKYACFNEAFNQPEIEGFDKYFRC